MFPHFTKENARQYAIKSHAARKEAQARTELALKAIATPEMTLNALVMQDAGTFASEMLKEVREEIRGLWKEIKGARKSGESKTFKEYTDALSRLAEIERQLAGRPLPGSLRPKSPASKRSTQAQAEPEEG